MCDPPEDMELHKDTEVSDKGADEQPGMVDFTRTEENPQTQDLVPVDETTIETGERMSETLIPVDVSGGCFGSAYFGPTSMSETQGLIHGHGQKQQPCAKHNGNCRRLTDYICLFPDQKLSTARKSKVFGGVETSEIVDDQPLAIKMVYDFTEQNYREAKNLVKLRPHTNVVTIRQAGVCSQAPMRCMYIAMERCSTENLESYIEKRRKNNIPYNIRQSVQHSKQVIEAVQHIHRNGILHRDLKPSSVLFSLSGRDLKICDFGQSKELEHGRSVVSLSMLKVGTDGYRAPETYNQNVITKATDVFSLALVVHHLLSYGFHPYGPDPEAWNFCIKRGKGLDLSRLRAPFHKIAKDMLVKMLKLRPEERLKIEEVAKEFRELDWLSSLTRSLVESFKGTVKGVAGKNLFTFTLLTSAAAQEIIQMGDTDWTFRLNTVPHLNISSLKQVVDEEPSGYIVTPDDGIRKVTDTLAKNNQMAWIDISNKGGDCKFLILLCDRDYHEPFGVFIPNPKTLSHILGQVVSKHPKSESRKVEGGATAQASPQPSPKHVEKDEQRTLTTEMSLIPWWILDWPQQK